MLIFLPLTLSSKKVDMETAYKIAANFLNAQIKTRSCMGEIYFVWNGEDADTRSVGIDPAFYVFESKLGGFVIVSGDDVTKPILGYSEEGEFDVDNIPDNLRWWLSEWSNGINFLRTNNAKPTTEISKLWKDLGSKNIHTKSFSSKRLLATAEWNQTYPFNNKCPIYNGVSTFVGCVPTAMAIMMKYYEWPKAGVGFIEGYSYSDNFGTSRSVSGYYLGHDYKWENMPLNYLNCTQSQVESISQLMKDCATASKAKFGVDQTSASVYDALLACIKHMGYDSSCNIYERHLFTAQQWRKKLYESLDALNPVWYSGKSKDSGHSFVIDGYDSDGNFHINWGWGGYCNGYFDMPNFRDYKYKHYAVFGLKRDSGGSPVGLLFLNKGFDFGVECRGLRFVSENDYPVRKNVRFQISYGCLQNVGNSNFSGKVLIAMVDKSGNIKEILNEMNINELKPRSGYTELKRYCTIHKDIEIGDRIKLFYTTRKSDEIMPVRYCMEEGFVGELPITDQYFIDEVTSLKYKTENKIIEIITKPNIEYKLQKSNGIDVENSIVLDDGKIIIDASTLEHDTYMLILSKGSDCKNLKLIIGGN